MEYSEIKSAIKVLKRTSLRRKHKMIV